jgi:hypothetical protein
MVRPRLDSTEWTYRMEQYAKGTAIAQAMKKEGLDPFAHYLYLGEVVSGHCAVVTEAGRIVWLLHPEEFELVPDDDA